MTSRYAPPTYGPAESCPCCNPDDERACGPACSPEHQAAISRIWQAVPSAVLAIVHERAEVQAKRETGPTRE